MVIQINIKAILNWKNTGINEKIFVKSDNL